MRLLLPLLLFVALNANAAAVRLVDAVKSGDRATVRTLLQQRIDVNATEPDGTTALHWAARMDDSQTASRFGLALLRRGYSGSFKRRHRTKKLQRQINPTIHLVGSPGDDRMGPVRVRKAKDRFFRSRLLV